MLETCRYFLDYINLELAADVFKGIFLAITDRSRILREGIKFGLRNAGSR